MAVNDSGSFGSGGVAVAAPNSRAKPSMVVGAAECRDVRHKNNSSAYTNIVKMPTGDYETGLATTCNYRV